MEAKGELHVFTAIDGISTLTCSNARADFLILWDVFVAWSIWYIVLAIEPSAVKLHQKCQVDHVQYNSSPYLVYHETLECIGNRIEIYDPPQP